MSLTLSCKLVEIFAMICAVLLQNQNRKSSPRYRYTLALNPAFSVAPIESPRFGGRSLWRILQSLLRERDYNVRCHLQSICVVRVEEMRAVLAGGPGSDDVRRLDDRAAERDRE